MCRETIRWRLARCAGILLLGTMACGEAATTPASREGVVRLLAPATMDTIDAEPRTVYVLRAVGADGEPIVGTSVAFTTVNARVASPGGGFVTSLSARTDSRGEVAVEVKYGQEPGPGSVIGLVPTLQRSDTLSIRVTPGAMVDATIMPADTVVLVGTAISVIAFPVDRRGNAIGDPLPVVVDSGSITKSGNTFTGTRFGVSELAAEVGAFTVTTTVTVVPDGEIAYTRSREAWIARLDGSGAEQLGFSVPQAREASVAWNPAGDRIVVGGTGGFTVFDLVSETVLPGAWPGGVAGSDVIWPRFGPGGKVWYSSADGNGGWDLREMNPDGTGAAITIETDRFTNSDFFPSWSPDGSQFVFTADWEVGSRYLLRISNAETTSLATLNVEGVTPVWSPDGSLLAYQELGLVGVVAPDLSTDLNWRVGWGKGVTWSPAGDMLVGIGDGEITILDVATGETLALPWFGDVSAVSWRPR